MEKISSNLKYIVFSLLSFISVFKHIEIFIENNILLYLVYVILIISLFLFYKKLYKNIVLDKKYLIFILIMSFILVLGYSYEITSTSKLFWGSIPNLLISIIKILGYYYFFKSYRDLRY